MIRKLTVLFSTGLLVTGCWNAGIPVFASQRIGFLAADYAHRSVALADDDAEDKAIKAKVRKAVTSMDFEIQVQTIYPQYGPSIQSTGEYSFKLTGGKATSFLPFFGEVDSAVLPGEDSGIKFTDETVKPTLKKKGKKDGTVKYILDFKVNTIDDEYTFYVEIWDEGQASIRVSSIKRSSMSYSGELLLPE